MKIAINIPQYAIEQGKVYVNGKALPTKFLNKIKPYFYGISFCDNAPVRTVREKLFKPAKTGRYVVITKSYSDKSRAWLNTTKQGYVNSYSEALEFYREFKTTGMEGASFSIKTQLIG